MLRIYGLVWVVGLVLWVYCLIDAITSREDEVRNLPKLAWVVIVLLFPFVGSIAWIVGGRPDGRARPASRWERAQPEFPEYDRPGRAAALDPEKDAEFLRQVRARAEEQREAYRRRQGDDGQPPPAP